MAVRSRTSYFRPLLAFILVVLGTVVHDYFKHTHQLVHHQQERQAPAAAVTVLQHDPQKPPFPSDPKKPVVYLIQLEGNQPPPNMGGADIVCITWKQAMKPCAHVPGSSWAQGRNYLWKMVTKMEKKYMYYIFMDEDITLTNLTLFEEYLVTWQPPVGVPDGIAQLQPQEPLKDREALRLHSFDAAFNAFHHDVVHDSLVLPYSDLFDEFSWWIAQLNMIYLCQVFFDNEVVGFMWVKSTNTQHRPYPRGWNVTASDEFFHKYMIVDDRMQQSWKGYSWTTPGPAAPKDGLQRYPLSEEFLNVQDLNTPYWNRIREIKASSDSRPPMKDYGVSITGPDSSWRFGFNKK